MLMLGFAKTMANQLWRWKITVERCAARHFDALLHHEFNRVECLGGTRVTVIG